MATDPERVETVAMSQAASSHGSTSKPSFKNDGRFLPGTLLVSRYRIVSRLGEGGMGEVFRADDLVLGQPVALKFLPESAKGNENLLTRFYEEVRITRQISHANVCRVYDIGEADGHLFLSMEYIDGEDLRGLLRRIGRLPGDKALEFARKLCAGLAAAHTRGVLHRDLKPANIMIDARGELRITDFGLAAVAEQLKGPEARHGTPAYMAPEQLEGREVTAQSDIYALGLVLYEMFTGKAPFAKADSAAEMLRLRKESRITNPSTVISDLDPAVERAILRCLDPDPKSRPASALDLARALPGGDPLAAALAAGETPSPDMVAASGSSEALRPMIAIGLLAAFAVCLIALIVVRPKNLITSQIPLEYPPDALAVKAREIARDLGYPERPADFASGFNPEIGYVPFLQKKVSGIEAWNRALAAPPSPLIFWYRQSPGPIVPESINGAVALDDPLPAVPGMVGMILDPDGRLRQFTAVPPQVEVSSDAARPVDWSPLFAAAHLDMAAFKPADPQWTPLAATDARAAWTGVYPGREDLPIRVEAAAFRGRSVYFQIVWPWTAPDRVPVATTGPAPIAIGSLLVLLAAGLMLARRNWQAGRGDLRGATRLALFGASMLLLVWLFSVHHVATWQESLVLFRGLERAVFGGLLMWVPYVALEPWVRRRWPQSMIVWSRVLAGNWRDPVVGRDVLCGVLGGTLTFLLLILYFAASIRLSNETPVAAALPATGLRFVAANFARALNFAVEIGLVLFLALFFLRVLLRNQWLATAVLAVFVGAVGGAQSSVYFVFYLVVAGAAIVAMMRFGLFASVAGIFTALAIVLELMTPNFSAWYGQGSLAVVIVLGALALWGFRASLGGQNVLNGTALEK